MRTLELGGLKVRLCGGDDGDGAGEGLLVVLLHGFGAPGTDLVPLADEIIAPKGTRFAFPEAPHRLPADMGDGRCWWMIDMMALQLAMITGSLRDLSQQEPEGLAAAREKLLAMLTAMKTELGMTPEKTVLGGFSQGAMLSCDVALMAPESWAGLALMSGTLLAEARWREQLASIPTQPPVIQSHGRQDPLLSFAAAERLRDLLVESGFPVTWVPFDGGHGIAPSVLTAFGDMLAQID